MKILCYKNFFILISTRKRNIILIIINPMYSKNYLYIGLIFGNALFYLSVKLFNVKLMIRLLYA